MTMEEAITILDKLWEDFDRLHETTDYVDGYEEMQALAMAIEALSAEPKTIANNCDLISRADAIEAVQDVDTRESVNVSEAVKAINALPSADRPTIEHDREWIIGCIKHDGFIKTDRFDKANNIIIDALESCDRPSGEWIPVDGKLPKVIGHHVLVTIKWADDDLEVCEMCPTVADRYNIIAFQDLPEPYQGEPIKSELQCGGARMENTK